MLEDIPRHGPGLAEELRQVGGEIKRQAEQELADLYPADPGGATPDCLFVGAHGALRSAQLRRGDAADAFVLAVQEAQRKWALRHRVERSEMEPPSVEFEVFEPEAEREVRGGTVTRAKATCLCCGTVLPPVRVRAQLAAQKGGANVISTQKDSGQAERG